MKKLNYDDLKYTQTNNFFKTIRPLQLNNNRIGV